MHAVVREGMTVKATHPRADQRLPTCYDYTLTAHIHVYVHTDWNITRQQDDAT